MKSKEFETRAEYRKDESKAIAIGAFKNGKKHAFDEILDLLENRGTYYTQDAVDMVEAIHAEVEGMKEKLDEK